VTAATEAALYRAWQASGSSEKVLLSLFETAIVEANCKNLASRAVPESLKYPHEGVAAGDHDSVGVMQQRASWGSVASRMNVEQSATRFLNKAKRLEKSGQSAGQLAQAVQVSAFPLKYDAVAGKAQLLIARQRSSGRGVDPTPVTVPVGAGSGGGGAVGGLLDKISERRTWMRVVWFVLGFVLVMIAIAKLTGNNELSPMTKRVAKLVVTRKVTK
jgi:hypothetical protein